MRSIKIKHSDYRATIQGNVVWRKVSMANNLYAEPWVTSNA
ncbi:hypothetical protein JCM19240_3704 [Vibrio maritimus]|uniref:Uncharacterized protein n=1 Tax=Vibrio maritimus TaxID=990268 RepID=A0A090T998_9VIBR|nr:hypothetical protein JCM19240_3704 [Vibrio maritimus]